MLLLLLPLSLPPVEAYDEIVRRGAKAVVTDVNSSRLSAR